jgi:hypothetical protein
MMKAARLAKISGMKLKTPNQTGSVPLNSCNIIGLLVNEYIKRVPDNNINPRLNLELVSLYSWR